MIYTKMTKTAMRICFAAHKEQTDKSGLPYVFHPFHVAEQMDTEEEVAAALLHDVAEDTDITFDDMKKLGISDNVICALKLLTHDENVPYMDYVRKIAEDPLAAKVKKADLVHNSDLSRLDVQDEEAMARAEKYRQALKLL